MVLRRRGLVFGAAALLVVGILGGCARGGSEVVESPSSVVTMAVGHVDEFHIALPEGWGMVPLKRKGGFTHSVFSADGGKGFSAALLRVGHESVRELKKYRGQESGDHFVIDVAKERDQYIRGDQENGGSAGERVLPDRLIAADCAFGYEYLYTENGGVSRRFEKWFVGRHDGLWTITLVSAPGETVVPAEAVAALDTIEWIPAGGAGSSASPVPTAVES